MATLQETLTTRADVQNEDIEKIIERSLQLQEEARQKAGVLSNAEIKDIASDLQIDPKFVETAIAQIKIEQQERRAKEKEESLRREAQEQKKKRILMSLGGGALALLALLFLIALSGQGAINEAAQEATKARERLENVMSRHAEIAQQQISLAGGDTAAVASAAQALRNATDAEQKLSSFNSLNAAINAAAAALPLATTPEALQIRQELRFQLEGAQNRVSTERGRYIDAVATWNTSRTSLSARLALFFGLASDKQP
jgi:hypothetical protein